VGWGGEGGGNLRSRPRRQPGRRAARTRTITARRGRNVGLACEASQVCPVRKRREPKNPERLNRTILGCTWRFGVGTLEDSSSRPPRFRSGPNSADETVICGAAAGPPPSTASVRALVVGASLASRRPTS